MKLGLSKTEYPFDYFFAKASSERTAAKEECHLDCDDDDDDDDDDGLSSDSDGELTVMSKAVGCSDNVACHSSVDASVTQ